jgi:hypothetical protein
MDIPQEKMFSSMVQIIRWQMPIICCAEYFPKLYLN